MPVATILKMPYAVRIALITGVLAIVIVGFLAIRVIVNHEGLDKVQSPAVSNTALDVEALEARYVADVQEIITGYIGNSSVDNPDLSTVTAQAQERLLSLKVPASERDNHLALVLDFDAVKIAIADGDSTSLDAALSAIASRREAN